MHRASQPFFKTLLRSCLLKVTFLMRAQVGWGSHTASWSNFTMAFATLPMGSASQRHVSYVASMMQSAGAGRERGSNSTSNLPIPRSPCTYPELRGSPELTMTGNVNPQFPPAFHGVIISFLSFHGYCNL